MLCEVEFLAVGDGSRPGDAIIVRYGDPGAYQLMVFNGGTANCGETLVAHLKKHFGALVSLEDVVLTHSSADHAFRLARTAAGNPCHACLAAAAAIKKEYDIIAEIVDLAIAQGFRSGMDTSMSSRFRSPARGRNTD
jgi:glyoxylase-like metal-dependent hydrolase (beta-lactamase superfamily II)